MKILLPSAGVHSRDPGSACISQVEVALTASIISLFATRDAQAEKLAQDMGFYLPCLLRNLFFFICLVTCDLAQLEESCYMMHGWKSNAELESFGSGQAEGGV